MKYLNDMFFFKKNHFLIITASALFLSACGKKGDPAPNPPTPKAPVIRNIFIDNISIMAGNAVYNTNPQPVIRIVLSEPINQSSVQGAVSVANTFGVSTSLNISLLNNDSVVQVQPSSALSFLTKFILSINNTLESASGGKLYTPASRTFITKIDSSRKFTLITDNELLDKVQEQTFKYFWDFGHPVSGLARERNTSSETVTSGGSGFGIMAIPVAVNRGFITRAQGLARMQQIVNFLKNTAVKVKGAFSHWLNGTTGAIIPFSTNDNGADLVETSYLMMGLLTARQYFNGVDASEINLRNDITTLYNNVEWDWFRQGGQNILYWHYSPDKGWIMNFPIKGWNECLITYVLAASSPTHGVPAVVYTSGWKSGSDFLNGNTYYGYQLPLGPNLGGPLFFEQYSFLGINPNGLSDASANYFTQAKNHSLINYNYCKANPQLYFGYSDSIWGLTASDIEGGYTASSPTNDRGFIAPTAALSSMPFTPNESIAALKFFYYVLGDKIWKQYGFVDAFSLHNIWFADSFLAIDQGPIIGMIENYRTGLLWNLFTSCPEVKTGMLALGFTAPYL